MVDILLPILMISWSCFALSMQVRGLTHFCILYWFALYYILLLQVWPFPDSNFFFFELCWDNGHISLYLPPDKFADIQQLALSILQIQPVTVHQVMSFGQGQFLCQWQFPTAEIVSCHSEWHVNWLSLSCPLVFFCPLFPFSFALTGTIIPFATVSSSLAISASWCGYCYRCHIYSLGLFIFRVLVCHYQLVDPGVVLCLGLILPCRSFRQLPLCCIEWLSTYLVEWLPCTWITVLQKLIFVIKVVQFLLFFLGWPAGYWVWPTSTVLLLFEHTFLPISMWRLIICHRVSCFWSGIFSLRWPKHQLAFGAYHSWICWHPPIPLIASIITLWKHHYFWGPWGWLPSTILGHFRLVICFLLLH